MGCNAIICADRTGIGQFLEKSNAGKPRIYFFCICMQQFLWMIAQQ